MNDEPKMRFTGIFLPAEILQMEELTPTDQILLAWIDALYCEERGGCFASNEYLASKLKLKINTLKILISKLVKLGLVERVSFDGRTRVIRSCISFRESWLRKPTRKEEDKSTSEVDLNQPQGLKRINPSGSSKSTPLIYIDKRENKEDIYSANAPEKYKSSTTKKKEKPPKITKVKHGSHVELSEDEYKTLCDKYTKDVTDDLIDRVNDYCESKGESYKSYAAAIRTFYKNRRPQTPTSSYKSANQDKDGNDIDEIRIANRQAWLDESNAIYKKAKQLDVYVYDGVTYVQIGDDKIYFDNKNFKESIGHVLRKKRFYG